MAMIYCQKCGCRHSDKAECCPKCGLKNNAKSIFLYLVLCWFLGALGIHRFYAGKIVSGIVMLVLSITIVGIVITIVWALIDFFVGLCNVDTPEKIFK